MTRDELNFVKQVLLNIKPAVGGEPHPKVQLAINYVEKDLALRAAQRDNFKNMYETFNENSCDESFK